MSLPVLTIKLLVLSYILAKRQLIHNRTAQRDSWNQSYDFIVVGAGVGGCVVANRLTEDPNINVLLLEAGSAQDAIWTDIYWAVNVIEENRPDVHWHYYDEPSLNAGGMFPGRRINEFTGRVIGGSTSHNGMAYNRGNRRLYDSWERDYGAVGWSYSDVLPYFLRWENNTDSEIVRKNPNYHATGGPVQVSSTRDNPKLFGLLQKAHNELGYANIDINGPNQTGSAILQAFIDTRGLRVSSGSAYIDPNPHPNNLHVVTRALVIKVLFNGTTAVGIEFNRNDTSYRVYATKEIILSGGAYNTPQLLMLSGVGIKSHLQEFKISVLMELPVGNSLMLHPSVPINNQVLRPDYYGPVPPLLTLQQLSERLYNGTGPLGAASDIALSFSTGKNYEKDYPNILTGNSVVGSSFSSTVALVRPRSRGTVQLISSSPYILPRINPNYYGDSRDFEDILDALRIQMFILESNRFGISPLISLPSFESMGCPVCSRQYMYECTEGLKCLIRYSSQTANHPGGTCTMGDIKRNDVVVSPRLEVKNLHNLRVCDASIFPVNPNANPAAAVFMIGERCAQFIKDNYHLN